MHTMAIRTKEKGPVRIHHNGDWSGMAIVSWKEGRGEKARVVEVEVPAEALRACSIQFVKDEIASLIEDADFGVKFDPEG